MVKFYLRNWLLTHLWGSFHCHRILSSASLFYFILLIFEQKHSPNSLQEIQLKLLNGRIHTVFHKIHTKAFACYVPQYKVPIRTSVFSLPGMEYCTFQLPALLSPQVFTLLVLFYSSKWAARSCLCFLSWLQVGVVQSLLSFAIRISQNHIY